MVALMSYGSQLSGNSVLTYYLPTMYTQLGVASTDRRLLLTFANSIVSCTGAVFGSATNDKIGRRTKLWVGSFVLAILFAAVTGFSSYFEHSRAPTSHAKSLSNAGIAFIFLFGCAYSFVYTPLTPTYCAETLDNHTRATGMGIHVIMNNTANFYNTYITAVAFKAIAWKYYLVFVCLNVVYGECWANLVDAGLTLACRVCLVLLRYGNERADHGAIARSLRCTVATQSIVAEDKIERTAV